MSSVGLYTDHTCHSAVTEVGWGASEDPRRRRCWSPTGFPQHNLYLGWLSKKHFLAARRPALLSARALARNTHTHAWSMCRVCVCVCLFLWLMRFAKQHFLRVRLAVMMVFRLSKLQTKHTISVLWDFSSWPNLCIRRPVDNSDDQLHKDSDSDSGSYIFIYTGLQKK